MPQNDTISFRTWISDPLNQFICLFSLIPVILIALYIQHYAVSVPFFDQWVVSVNLAIKTKTDTLKFQDLLAQHAEHRIFFTNLVTVLLTYTTNWDTKLENWVSFALACANLALLAQLFFKDEPRGLTLVLIPFALLIFSFRQGLGWLSGFMNCWHFCTFFFLLSLSTLKNANVGWKPLALSAFWVFCAMYSLGSGIPIWILLIPTLWMLDYRRWQYLLFWIGAAGLSYAFYFTDYNFGVKPFPTTFRMVVEFFLEYLGNSFVTISPSSQITARWIGVLGIGLFVTNVAYLKYKGVAWSKLAVWVTLALFVLGTDFGTALRRSGWKPQAALSERYVIHAMLFWIGIVGLGAMSIRYTLQNSPRKFEKYLLVNGNLLCLELLLGYYTYANYYVASTPPVITAEHETCLVAYPVTQDLTCLEGLHGAFRGTANPSREKKLLESIAILAKYRLGVFSEYAPGSIMLPYHYDNAAQEALQQGKTQQALGYYKRGLELYPQEVSLYLARGEVYVSMGRPQQALNNFNQALRWEPYNVTALNQRGALYLAQGQTNKARADFESVLMRDPYNTFAQSQLAQLDVREQ